MSLENKDAALDAAIGASLQVGVDAMTPVIGDVPPTGRQVSPTTAGGRFDDAREPHGVGQGVGAASSVAGVGAGVGGGGGGGGGVGVGLPSSCYMCGSASWRRNRLTCVKCQSQCHSRCFFERRHAGMSHEEVQALDSSTWTCCRCARDRMPNSVKQQRKSPAPKEPGRAQTSPVLLTLGEDHCNLIFSPLSARHLMRLRRACSTARKMIDRLPIWAEMLEKMNKMNRNNVSPFDNRPFAWLPKAERDENYQKRSDALNRGWSRKDPRIRKSWASLTSFEKCAELYAFSRKTVERIQRHLPILEDEDDGIPWPGCGIPSSEDVSSSVILRITLSRIREVYHDHGGRTEISARFRVFFRIAQLNTAMKDLRREAGPRWYRESGSANSDVVIKETRGTSLQKAINRFYCCDEDRQHRWSGHRWGTDYHLHYFAWKRAASRRLRKFLGEDMCERIEVLGKARRDFEDIMDDVDEMDVYGEGSSFYSGDSSGWGEDEWPW